MEGITLQLSVDDASVLDEPLLFDANTRQAVKYYPAPDTRLDARCSVVRVRLLRDDAKAVVDVEANLAHISATDPDNAWVLLPGSRPVASCSLDDAGYTICVDVRCDAFLPAVLTAVRVVCQRAGPQLPSSATASRTPPRAPPVDDDDANDEVTCRLPIVHQGWLLTTPRSGESVRAWRGVLSCADQCSVLEADAIRLAQLYRARPGTFWMPAEGAEPRCALESFALDVLRFHLRNGGPSQGTPPCPVAGAEWWVQVRDAGLNAHTDASVAFHWDGDEGAMRRGSHVPPVLATVTYLGNVGAPTLVLPIVASGCGKASPAPTDAASWAFLSYPEQGKHLAFDGRLLHGAPSGYASPAAAGAPRVSLLVNVWLAHRPLEAQRLPDSVITLLSRACLPSPSWDGEAVGASRWSVADVDAYCLDAMRINLGVGGGTHPPLLVRGLPRVGDWCGSGLVRFGGVTLDVSQGAVCDE